MSRTYSLFNKRTNIYEPNLSRQRQPFSGPISSEALNLFYDQFVVDAARLDNNIKNINDKIDDLISLRSEFLDQATPGYYIEQDLDCTIYTQVIKYDNTTEQYTVQSATPYYNSAITYYGLGTAASKIALLSSKLDGLEKILNTE